MDSSEPLSAPACAHCGLPVPATLSPATGRPSDGAPLYCCHGCRLVALITGPQEQGEHSWNLLRLGLGALLSMNVMMVSLLLYLRSVEPDGIQFFRLVLLGFSSAALLLLVPPFIAGSARELAARKVSFDSLIALGALSAFTVSAAHTLTGTGEVYFDTATMLPVLVTLGKMIEASGKRRAADLLHALETLLPTTALRQTPSRPTFGAALLPQSAEAGCNRTASTTGLGDGDMIDDIPIDQLQPGDLVLVRPGARVPVDGMVIEGASSIEEAPFTGEFLPRGCRAGDRVIAGTVNGTGPLLVRAERTGRDLLLHGIVGMVRDAWRTPSNAERIAERAAALFIPAVLAIAAATALWWTARGNPGQGLFSALSVLVVACPCTMGLATPLATSLAVARAAREGIAVRGGSAMESVATTGTLFFDKTGTITTGLPVVREIQPVDPRVTPRELLGTLAALESASEHQLGRAVVVHARKLGIERGTLSEPRVEPGCGICGTVSWGGVTRWVSAGTAGFAAPDLDSPESRESCTAIHVSWDAELRGRLLLSDAVRPGAADCVARLHGLGIRTLLLSGDSHSAAASVAQEVGIREISAPRTPAQKLEEVRAAMDAGEKVAMVGDGINDAPGLAAAHVGIALGGGMDLAKLAGQVVILSGELGQIPWLIRLSRQTRRIIRENFAWSFGYNAIALAAAAAGVLHPLLAALSMVISSLTVLGNSLRVSAFPGYHLSSPPGSTAAGATPGHGSFQEQEPASVTL